MTTTDEPGTATARCACGWESTGLIEVVVTETIDHGQRVHNMIATREEVLARLGGGDPVGAPADDGAS